MTSTARPSRRGFLMGTGLAVLGAAGGVAAGLLADRSPDEVQPPNPAVLLAAARAERDLLQATVTRNPPAESLLRRISADHEAHLAAILAEIAIATGTGTPTVVATQPAGPGISRADRRALEASAASAGADRALALTGRSAALLASIPACEATHAELLS